MATINDSLQDFQVLREAMIEHQMEARGIHDPAVLRAVREVPREAFVPPDLVEFAYDDAPLPIDEEQTISQPYIVALMTEMLELEPGDRVLDVGTGSGYAAAVLSRIVDEVYTVERHGSLAESARRRFEELGYNNIHVRHGDGTLGWGEHGPYDAIVAAASGPKPPQPLLDQLAVGGRLVMPTGPSPRLQHLIRIRRVSEDEYQEENLGRVQFVPLIGEAGWTDHAGDGAGGEAPAVVAPASLPERIKRAAEPFPSIEEAYLDRLLNRIGDAHVVLLGEATHGTSEFYRMRTRITQALIEQHGFTVIAVEADWPDAALIDRYVRDLPDARPPERPFQRFPTWMWANMEVADLVEWLRAHNQIHPSPHKVGFYGLDLYSLYTSIDAVLRYLDDVDPEAAAIARQRYGCLTPYEADPAAYGAAAVSRRYRACESEVVEMLHDLMDRQMQYGEQDGQRFLDAVQNARLVANAERYYRTMYYGSRASWNLRDSHMFDTLQTLLEVQGPETKAVVWAHNSHLGNAAATEMGARGEHNVGQLCREAFEEDAYLIGFGTDHGTVAAASQWGGPMEVKLVRPAHTDSYEHLCHDAGPANFFLPLRHADAGLRDELAQARLERAIGVIYRPETELQSHYFHASLPHQFDEYIWLGETSAVTPLTPESGKGLPETFPFGM